MIVPLRPDNEAKRLQELRSLGILDTQHEALFDDIVKLGAYITGCPISLISLIDEDRQWFKARFGLEAEQTHRDISFCGHAIHQDSTFVVEDALTDERFADNPLVTGEPNIRFYAGRPLVTQNGFRIGTLCTIDKVPRKLTAEELGLMEILARQATFLIEQRRNELALKMAQLNSQILFENSPLIMASTKGSEHIFEYVNRKDAELFGRTDAMGKSLLELQPEASTNGFLKVLDDVYRTGETQSLRNVILTIDRKPRHFDMVVTARYGLNGAIDGVMSMIDDITERKQMELELKELYTLKDKKLSRMARLLEQVPLNVALLEGPDHRLVFANKLYRESYLKTEHYEGKPLAEIFPHVTTLGYIDAIDDVYQSGKTFQSTEMYFKDPTIAEGDQGLYLNILYQATQSELGAHSGVLVAIADVTEQVQARAEIIAKVDELRAEREIREHFVATLSHDLQNPLAAAKVGAERIKSRPDNPAKVTKIADRIVANIDRTERMVRNLLDANRLRAGEGLPIATAPCCLGSVVQQAVEGLAMQSGRELIVKMPADGLAGQFDAEGVHRIVENLASNAIKYGDPNSPIVISCAYKGQVAELSVHNQGPVIPQVEQATLFDAHSRTDTSLNSDKRGWGLGLSLVRGIAQAHRGSVRVVSEEGQGTTFFVNLPLVSNSQA